MDESVLKNYRHLFSKKQQWINCENDFPNMDSFLIDNWLERLYLERLQQKSLWFEKELKSSKSGEKYAKQIEQIVNKFKHNDKTLEKLKIRTDILVLKLKNIR